MSITKSLTSLLVFLLLLHSAVAQVSTQRIITTPVTAGGNSAVISITNDLGPTTVYVQFGSASIAFSITYYAADTNSLNALIAQQPTAATVSSNTISLALVGATSISASDLGGSCKLETFTATSPRPPCMPLTYTSSPSPPARSASNAAYVFVTVPEETRVCVNSYCVNPLYYALSPISPQSFTDIGNGIVYDAMQGLMWQRDLLPAQYPYDSQNNDNFPTINSAAQACYALTTGGACPLCASTVGLACLFYYRF